MAWVLASVSIVGCIAAVVARRDEIFSGFGQHLKLMAAVSTDVSRVGFYRAKGEAAAALPILEQLSHQQPDNPGVLPWLAQCYLRTDRIAEGRTALDTALRLKLPGATLAPVVLAYANYYESKADYAEAERLYEQVAL